MFALKRASVMSQFTSKLTSVRSTFYARKFTTTIDDQTIIKNDEERLHLQTSLQNHNMPLSSSLMEPELKKKGDLFENVYHDMIREITDFNKFTLKSIEFDGIKNHFIKMMEYVLSDGQRQHLNSCVNMYRDLMVNKEMTTENIKQAHLLGWCIELQLAAFLIDDDIGDKSEKRRGKTCWHKVKGMERIAINDLLMIESGCNLILSRFFGHLPCYTGLIKTVTETFMTSLMGTLLEGEYNEMGVDIFTYENYKYSAEMKGSHYRFYMPTALACVLAGYDLKVDQKVFDNIKQITLIIGVWYQAQNDFIDCYVDPVTKPGHDIENGKLSWFAAMAMERGSEEQKNVMRKNYGKYDQDCVAKVKQVYNDLQLREMFLDWKKRNQDELRQKTNELFKSDEVLRNACLNFFNYAYYH